MPLAAGTRLGPYEIVAALGAGGMGEVYRARDPRLQREVAIKALPADLASSPDRMARFEREATTVAGLNHPNIVVLHSLEEAQGIRFLTMELVEGQSLDRVSAPGGLPIPRVIDLGIAIADALAAAHDRNIVHRDLKPANVMVTKDGRVKVLDFGLAKLMRTDETSREDLTRAPTAAPRPGEALTSAGMVVGTVPYMSPEQLNGDAVDARTDLFSLGVVLYEMATGERPFRGRTQAETISSILRDVPTPVREARPDAPQDLARILDRCLEKDPEYRFQTARDVRNELQSLRRELEVSRSGTETRPGSSPAPRVAVGRPRHRIVAIGLAAFAIAAIAATLVLRDRSGHPSRASTDDVAGADPRSIAVLPFVNMSSDKEQEYFSDGISEELLNLLARVPTLKVAARTSSFSFKGKDVGIPEIARQLHVANVLEGSIRKSGDQIRITAQLVHAADGFHLWSQTYDRRLDDIFRIQDEIAGKVVKELKVTLLGATPRSRPTDPRAYAMYVQATQIGLQVTAAGFATSDSLYREVLKIDPSYAPAWDGLARNTFLQSAAGFRPVREGVALAREAAEKALALDDGYAPAHARLGALAMTFDNDLPAAARHLERALALDPNGYGVLTDAGGLLIALGRMNESLAIQEELVRRNPLDVRALINLSHARFLAGQLHASIVASNMVLNLNPGTGVAHAQIAEALLLEGHADSALAEIEKEPTEVWRTIALPIAYFALGRRADSDAALARLIAKHERDASWNIAYVHAFRGERDRAFEWLDKAARYGDPGIADVAYHPYFTKLHSDPRWLPFLRRVGRAPEQVAKIAFDVTVPEQD